MDGFEDVTLSWKGHDYVVPAKKQLMLIARIEDALAGESGLQAVTLLFRREGPPHSRLAAAFGAALRYAGATVSDEEVYLSIHADIAQGSREQVAAKMHAMTIGLLAIISPPTLRELSGSASGPAAGEAEAAEKKA